MPENLSKRRYITEAEAKSYTGEASVSAAVLDLAEELIDAFVGPQGRHIRSIFKGIATGGSTTTLIDTSGDTYLGNYDDDYFVFCIVEIIGGANKGEQRVITASDRSESQITVDVAFGSAIGSTSVYRIYQLGKFPREDDVFHETNVNKYYKQIPEAVKRAVLAQAEFIIEKGTDYFSGATDKDSESIGDYGYQARGDVNRLISPVARDLLRGIINRRGKLIA